MIENKPVDIMFELTIDSIKEVNKTIQGLNSMALLMQKPKSIMMLCCHLRQE